MKINRKTIISGLLLPAMLGLLFISSFKYKAGDKKYDYLLTISTEFGDMKAILFDDTPIHKANFLKLAAEGKYDSTLFHRVIRNFMIQGGALSAADRAYYDTLPFAQQTLPNEIMERHKHKFGALAAARTGNPQKRSDISQFYIVENPAGAHHLDNNYTVFGQVVVGGEVIHKIAAQPVNGSEPVKPIYMTIKVDKVKRKDVLLFYGDVYSGY